jgi:hypothetical protein
MWAGATAGTRWSMKPWGAAGIAAWVVAAVAGTIVLVTGLLSPGVRPPPVERTVAMAPPPSVPRSTGQTQRLLLTVPSMGMLPRADACIPCRPPRIGRSRARRQGRGSPAGRLSGCPGLTSCSRCGCLTPLHR